jgi:hypothetical protein
VLSNRRRTVLVGLAIGMSGLARAADSDQWLVSGEIIRSCSIDYDCGGGADRCLQLNLDDRSTNQDTAIVSWRCNYAAGNAIMEFSSENQGELRNLDQVEPEGLAYLASYTGGDNSAFNLRSLQTPVIATAMPSDADVDVTGFIEIKLQTRSAPLLAGRYTDRITVTITPDAP